MSRSGHRELPLKNFTDRPIDDYECGLEFVGPISTTPVHEEIQAMNPLRVDANEIIRCLAYRITLQLRYAELPPSYQMNCSQVKRASRSSTSGAALTHWDQPGIEERN